MLSLRRGVVKQVDTSVGGLSVVNLVVEVDGADRPAYVDTAQIGECQPGDDVVVNTEAVDLGLGSGGRDVVLVNLTRGLSGAADSGRHVMKLNYTPLQSGVDPVEPVELTRPLGGSVAVFQLHGQLAPVVWAARQADPELRVGYVQGGGGALPGGYSRTVRDLRERDMLCDHLTAAPAYGGEGEAMSVAGALHAGMTERGWDAAVVGPGPGIIGSGTALGHGGMVALDSAHAAMALGCRTILVARASNGDPRERHRGVSHHTRTVLEMLLGSVELAIPDAAEVPAEAERHIVHRASADVEDYAASGLPARTMGRDHTEDALFFEAALVAGTLLAAH